MADSSYRWVLDITQQHENTLLFRIVVLEEVYIPARLRGSDSVRVSTDSVETGTEVGYAQSCWDPCI